MRTKTLLLFIFLLTGMAFSQQGGTGRITFDDVKWLLTSSSEKSMWADLARWGYERITATDFKKGSEIFKIIPEADGTGYYYSEGNASSSRREEMRAQAIKAGLKETVNNDDGRLIILEGNGFSVSIRRGPGIIIRKLKK